MEIKMTKEMLEYGEKLQEQDIGELIYFFEKACAVSGMILGINPFDQPGVEKYKKNINVKDYKGNNCTIRN